jgi:3-oxoadipate enol-lactonase
MPTIDADGCALHVEVEGPPDAPVLMLSNSLGADLHMWDPQDAAWSRDFRLIRYDSRGHGKSAAPKGPYTMERLARDAIAIMDALGVEKAHWCGLSLGGMVGMWLGANAGARIARLILSNTVPYYPVKDPWTDRIKLVREQGFTPLVDANMGRWFSTGFRESSPQVMDRMVRMFLANSVDGYTATCEAVRDMDHREILRHIDVPTLVIAGSLDLATTVKDAESICSRIPGAIMTVVEGAHIANVEQPEAYRAAVLNFLKPR